MTPARSVLVRFRFSSTHRSLRTQYRALRTVGFTREQANYISYGCVLANPALAIVSVVAA